MSAPNTLILSAIREAAANLGILEGQTDLIGDIAARLIVAIRGGGKVMFCGNGGSAADAQHLAAELEGRFLIDRAPLPAMALTVNTSSLTAIANDFGYDEVFARQVRGIAKPGDVLVAISTSGNSANVVAALVAARERGVATVGLTGASGGRMEPLCDLCLKVPTTATPRIQEMHILVGHIVCDIVERTLA
ncbi:MAG: SIS domain-containing protein [Rhodospirillales bacterium]|nr:MAG: SIS domain-containing protein [Rhodospirillales bacterium]